MTTDNVKILKSDYLPFLEEIKGKIKSACIQAYRRINKEIVLLYWDIGKKIVEKQCTISRKSFLNILPNKPIKH